MNDHPLVGIWPLKQAGPGRVINPYTKRAIRVGGATHTSVVQQLSVSANNPPVAAPPPKEKKLRKKPQLTERARPKKAKLAERMQAAEKNRAGLVKGRAPRPPKLSPVATTSAIDARLLRAEENRQGAAAEKAARLEQAAARRAQAQAYKAEVAEMQRLAPPVLPPPPQAALWGASPAADRPSFDTRNLAAANRRRAALEQKKGKARAKGKVAPVPDTTGLRMADAAARRQAIEAATIRRLEDKTARRKDGVEKQRAAERAREEEAAEITRMMTNLGPLDPPRTIHKIRHGTQDKSRRQKHKAAMVVPQARPVNKTNKRKTRELQLVERGSARRRYTSSERQTALEGRRLQGRLVKTTHPEALRDLVGQAEAGVHAALERSREDPALLEEYYVKLDKLQSWIDEGVEDTQTYRVLDGRLRKVKQEIHFAQMHLEEGARDAARGELQAQETERDRQRQEQEKARRGDALLQEIKARKAAQQEDYDRKNARHMAARTAETQAAAAAERRRQLQLQAAEQAAADEKLAKDARRARRKETAAAARGMVGTARAVTGGVRQAGPLVAGAAGEAARGLSSAATAAGSGVRQAMPAVAAGVAGAAKGAGAAAGRKKVEVMQAMQGARTSIGSAARKAAWRLFPNPQDWHATAYGDTQGTTQDAGPSEQLGHVSRASTFNEKQNVEDVLGPALEGPGPPRASAEPVVAARTPSGAREGYPELYFREERPVNRTFKEDWELNELRKAKEKWAKDKKLAWEAEQEAEKAAMEAQKVADYWRYTYPAIVEMERDEWARQRHEQSLLREMEESGRRRAAILQQPSPYAVLFEPSSVQQTAGNKRPQSPDAEWRKPESRVPGMRSESRSMSRAPAPPEARDAPVNFFP